MDRPDCPAGAINNGLSFIEWLERDHAELKADPHWNGLKLCFEHLDTLEAQQKPMRITALLTALLFLAACSQQPATLPGPVPVAQPYVKPPWLIDMQIAENAQAAQLRFQRAYIECQGYGFKLKGCDVLQQKRDTDERARLVSKKQQQEAQKQNAQETVLDEVKELEK